MQIVLNPDQMPRSAASDQGRHCLTVSLLWDARLKWVKGKTLSLCPSKNGSMHVQSLITHNRKFYLIVNCLFLAFYI